MKSEVVSTSPPAAALEHKLAEMDRDALASLGKSLFTQHIRRTDSSGNVLALDSPSAGKRRALQHQVKQQVAVMHPGRDRHRVPVLETDTLDAELAEESSDSSLDTHDDSSAAKASGSSSRSPSSSTSGGGLRHSQSALLHRRKSRSSRRRNKLSSSKASRLLGCDGMTVEKTQRDRKMAMTPSPAPENADALLTLHDVLSDEALSREYIEYCEQLCCDELVHFWFAVQSYRLLPSGDEPGAVARRRHTASSIYNMYLVPHTAKKLVLIDSSLVELIGANLEKPDPLLFNEAEQEVVRSMRLGSFPRFQETHMYISALKNRARQEAAATAKAKAKADAGVPAVPRSRMPRRASSQVMVSPATQMRLLERPRSHSQTGSASRLSAMRATELASRQLGVHEGGADAEMDVNGIEVSSADETSSDSDSDGAGDVPAGPVEPSKKPTRERTRTLVNKLRTSISGMLARANTPKRGQFAMLVQAVMKEEKNQEQRKKEAAEDERKEALRNKVLSEVIESETRYCEGLKTLLDTYATPLLTDKKLQKQLRLEPKEAALLFSNLRVIYTFHTVLLSDFTATDANVVDVFARNAPFLGMYTEYVSKYDKVLQMMGKLNQNDRFQAWLEDRRDGGMGIMSYLIMPIQRIPRYELLLRELKKYTDEDDEEYATLCDAFDAVHQVAHKVNERKRLVESMSEVLALQNRISDLPADRALLQPTRKLVRHGQLLYNKKRLWRRTKPCVVILFNDVLVWTSANWSFKGWIDLSLAILQEDCRIDAPSDEATFPFRVYGDGNQQLTLLASSEAEKESWCQDIEACIHRLHSLVASRRRRSVVGLNIAGVQ